MSAPLLEVRDLQVWLAGRGGAALHALRGIDLDVSAGELLMLAVLGLLVFGPDRLPDAVRKGSQTLRQLREMAVQARQQVADAAGMDEEQTRKVVEDLRDMHPRRLASSVLNPVSEAPVENPRRSTGIDPDLA